jgi:hypothetical protein
MSQTMNSRCFTCALLEKDPDLEETVTVLTLRRVSFPHTPVILTQNELVELQNLIRRWLRTLKQEDTQ